MKPPVFKLDEHLEDVEVVAWRGLAIDVGHLYDKLTSLGWKVDTEESNLMNAMSKTWRDEGIKVWLHLEQFVGAPPGLEVEKLDKIQFYRFDPAAMPATTMYEKMYEPGDEEKDWYRSHREAWDWLVENGDPQWDTFELLTPIALREVPAGVREMAWREIEEGVVLAETEG